MNRRSFIGRSLAALGAALAAPLVKATNAPTPSPREIPFTTGLLTMEDSDELRFGAGKDSTILYDGNCFCSDEVGSAHIRADFTNAVEQFKRFQAEGSARTWHEWQGAAT